MMILNIINTIAIAIGIGTSVNNTSFNYKKKTKQNAVQTISQEIDYTNSKGTINIDNGSSIDVINKYYLYTTSETSIYTDQFFMIANTTYAGTYNDGTAQVTYAYSIYELTNYYNSVINIRCNIKTQFTNNSAASLTQKLWDDPNNQFNEYIDMTLTNNTPNKLLELRSLAETTHINNISINNVYPSGNYETTFNSQNVNLQNQEKITYIYYEMYYMNGQNASNNYLQTIKPYKFYVEGSVLVPETPPIEVIDMPGLIFTVLSLPFSFISQAFNLTIFPGTPYQLNFTNLFMTIIAIFMLLWLIKKILK